MSRPRMLHRPSTAVHKLHVGSPLARTVIGGAAALAALGVAVVVVEERPHKYPSYA